MSSSHGIGASPTREEDPRFLTGAGCFSDDLALPGQAHAVVLRSPHPHALIRGIDSAAARALPGVLAVLTGADLQGRVQPIPSLTRVEPFQVRNADGSLMPQADQPALALDKVRYAGEPVAFVVAESRAQALDAAQAIAVDYAPLPAVMTRAQALAPGAPAIWDACPGNQSCLWQRGDRAATEAAFAAAHHVTRVQVLNNRIAPVFMEPRAALAEYDAAGDRLVLHTGSQSAHRLREALAAMLGLDASQLRVVTPDTGGGFGARGAVYPEMALVLEAARRLRRAVKWTAERSESFLTDTQARDVLLHGELALDRDGHFTALRVHADWRHGGYLPGRGIWIMVHYLVPTLGGVYAIPLGHVTLRGVFSNTTPLHAYRGIGRVEATSLMERLVDAAARETGIDRVELRRRNLLRGEQLPFTSVGGAHYESCTFAPHLERALALADWDGFAQRRAHSRAQGRLRGIGCSVYVENDGGAPSEYAEVCAEGNGVTLRVGTQNFGMGHQTVYRQILSERLGVPYASIRVIDGDTDQVARGAGSSGSRSMRVGGSAIVMSAERLIDTARAHAAQMLQASAADLDYAHGAFRIGATERRVTLAEVAAFAAQHGERLAAEADFQQQRESYSSGSHVCEVEIDPDTGRVRLLEHVLVTDVGRAINPMLVDGQVHGAAAQGIGQAALEGVVYDDSGQTLSGSFMDYTLPRADDLPAFTTATAESGESDNPLGVKGVGEGPTTGSPAAYMNALHDALAQAGGGDIQMPATPLAVWRALAAAGNRGR